MKNYIINNNCIYSEHKYELRSSSNSQVIRMTAMRAKCLSFIIENAHLEIIERQKITNALWGSRSHFVNDANLTQILYLIRRDLKALGINDLFITIPRQGLQVNREIVIEEIEPNKPAVKKLFFRKALAALTTVFSVTLGTMMYMHIH
ncbi:transcriptional regulator [Klebsiella quasipneumoniae]|uniref:winged helix-turn-helix domain-containing protein n=1 Tax=Klebsiella quasipneumoniae TaxID=1463165 RepID=UPI001299B296|nr:transcriptional regulator [Klebsiella quasipneumoniae]MCS6746670.1 transcriptional regulator [Klebsiella quasipneumoniae]MRE40026.1 transcriptional regulator [Klebsiella quasipneumoniae]MRF90185.1 transcriptional regulator [Klebsiella quasipneumoniae]HCI6434502.1 transcriptional regulator [Klebsiella quasipneumoniae subsp. similipneumoniae]